MVLSKFSKNRIDLFQKRFLNYDDQSYLFAAHAVFPILFTPKMLYHIWQNFRSSMDKVGREVLFDRMVVSDFLLSGMCKSVGFQLYEVEQDIRAYFLNELDEKFGNRRLSELSEFLYQYMDTFHSSELDENIRTINQLLSLAILDPKTAKKEIGQALGKALETRNYTSGMSIYILLESLQKQNLIDFEKLYNLAKANKSELHNESLTPVPIYSDTMGTGTTLLQIPIPEFLKKRIIIQKPEKKHHTKVLFLNLDKDDIEVMPSNEYVTVEKVFLAGEQTNTGGQAFLPVQTKEKTFIYNSLKAKLDEYKTSYDVIYVYSKQKPELFKDLSMYEISELFRKQPEKPPSPLKGESSSRDYRTRAVILDYPDSSTQAMDIMNRMEYVVGRIGNVEQTNTGGQTFLSVHDNDKFPSENAQDAKDTQGSPQTALPLMSVLLLLSQGQNLETALNGLDKTKYEVYFKKSKWKQTVTQADFDKAQSKSLLEENREKPKPKLSVTFPMPMRIPIKEGSTEIPIEFMQERLAIKSEQYGTKTFEYSTIERIETKETKGVFGYFKKHTVTVILKTGEEYILEGFDKEAGALKCNGYFEEIKVAVGRASLLDNAQEKQTPQKEPPSTTGQAGMPDLLLVEQDARPTIIELDSPSGLPVFQNELGMEFVYIPSGEYMMGCSDAEYESAKALMDELGYSAEDKKKYLENMNDEKPSHKVRISKGFWMSKYEVTKGDFKKFVQATGYKTEAEKGDGAFGLVDGKWKKDKNINWRKTGFDQKETEPVVCVSWNDAKAYCEWVSSIRPSDTELAKASIEVPMDYSETKPTLLEYRLPTEAEWEYAARAGTETMFYWGDGKPEKPMLNCADESVKKKINFEYYWKGYNDGYVYTSPVGSFPPNPFGLHDMLGNVWEWCEDWYDEKFYEKIVTQAFLLEDNKEKSKDEIIVIDPFNNTDDKYLVLRGGSWDINPWNLRVSNRVRSYSGARSYDVGFRVVLPVRS